MNTSATHEVPEIVIGTVNGVIKPKGRGGLVVAKVILNESNVRYTIPDLGAVRSHDNIHCCISDEKEINRLIDENCNQAGDRLSIITGQPGHSVCLFLCNTNGQKYLIAPNKMDQKILENIKAPNVIALYNRDPIQVDRWSCAIFGATALARLDAKFKENNLSIHEYITPQSQQTMAITLSPKQRIRSQYSYNRPTESTPEVNVPEFEKENFTYGVKFYPPSPPILKKQSLWTMRTILDLYHQGKIKMLEESLCLLTRYGFVAKKCDKNGQTSYDRVIFPLRNAIIEAHNGQIPQRNELLKKSIEQVKLEMPDKNKVAEQISLIEQNLAWELKRDVFSGKISELKSNFSSTKKEYLRY